MKIVDPPRRRSRALPVLAGLAALAGLAGLVLAAFRVGPPPEVAIRPERPAIGRRTAVEVRASEPVRGLATLRVELVQQGQATLLAEERLEPAPAWAPWRRGTAERTLAVAVGSEPVAGLKAGEATIRVTAARAGAWLRFPEAVVVEQTLPVRLVPPELAVTSTQTYVAQGGCEAVVYRVGETSTRDGVQAGGWFFPGRPLAGGGPRDRFALFAVPFDLADVAQVRLVAADDAGNEAAREFVDRFTPRPVRSDTIELDGGFLAKVVPEILAQTPALQTQGDLLADYLAINGELRRRNAAELVELAAASAPEFLWREPFIGVPGGQVMASFADSRSYRYQGREVDRQIHLGFDLASVKQAPVPAANRGAVVLARYFGIYGNTVVVDHGFGLMSLYAHLSAIAVQPGQTVERGQELGRSGATGLAGGDHLHFTFLLAGLPVTPMEWWDAHWVRDRIGRKLGPALPFSGATGGDGRPRGR